MEQTNQALAVKTESAPALSHNAIREVEEVRAAIISARQFPRNRIAAEIAIAEECKRFEFADEAFWSYPRGGEVLSDVSIRLLESIAQYWGNMNFGFEMLDRYRDGKTEGIKVKCFAIDYETNTRQVRIIDVPFLIYTRKKGITPITDPREQKDLAANYAMRAVRECIRGIIPRVAVDRAAALCKKTLIAKVREEPHADRVKKIVEGFLGIGVSQEMLERRLGHKVDLMVEEQFIEYRTLYKSIKTGGLSRESAFDFGSAERSSVKSSLNEKLGINQEPPKSSGDEAIEAAVFS